MTNPVVYFIKARNKDLFKIGFTSSSVTHRLRAINVGCPYHVELYATIPALTDGSTEKEIHDSLRQYHLKGEWFEVSLTSINLLLMNVQGHVFAGDKVKYARLAPTRKPTGKRKTRKSRGRPSLKCEQCSAPKGKRGKYCGDACRQKAFRVRKKGVA